MNEQNKRCKGCYFLGLQDSCNYIFIMDRRRPCPPGEECREYCTGKEMDMRKASWNTEEGKKMWQAGMSDAVIADYFRIPTGTVTSYRLKHWVTDKKRALVGEPKQPSEKKKESDSGQLAGFVPIQQIMEQNKAEAAQEHGIQPTPKEEARDGAGDHGSPLQYTVRPTEPEVGEPACAPARNDVESEGAAKKADPHPPALQAATFPQGKAVTVSVPRLDELDVMAAATEHLSGMKAVCTACAIQALWFWTGPADLRRAKKNIDWLLDHMEG